MKNVKSMILIILTVLLSTVELIGNQIKNEPMNVDNSTKKQIEEVVKIYVAAGDKQDVKLLMTVLHDNYRVIVNDPKENVIKEINKSAYIDFIDRKVFGGDPREVEIESITIASDLNATVQLKMQSSKAIFSSQFSLVKVNEKWLLVQDLVHMKPKI